MAKWLTKISSVLLSSLFIISCSNSSVQVEPKNTTVPDGKYKIIMSTSHIKYETFMFGFAKPILTDTMNSTNPFDPVNTIAETRKDSTILYKNDTVVTTRYAVPAGTGFLSQPTDTAQMNSYLDLLLKEAFPGVTIANATVTEYSIANDPMIFVDNQLVMKASFTATCNFKMDGVATTIKISGQTIQFGTPYFGVVPLEGWPKEIKTGSLEDLEIPLLSQ